MIEIALLTHQLTDDQKLVAPMAISCQKPAATGDQRIDHRPVPLQMTELLLDDLADLVDPRLLFLAHGEKLLSGFLSVRTWLRAKSFPDWRVYRVNQSLCHLSGFIQERKISRIANVSRSTCGVDHECFLIDGWCR
jgi:hypothetical protein